MRLNESSENFFEKRKNVRKTWTVECGASNGLRWSWNFLRLKSILKNLLSIRKSINLILKPIHFLIGSEKTIM